MHAEKKKKIRHLIQIHSAQKEELIMLLAVEGPNSAHASHHWGNLTRDFQLIPFILLLERISTLTYI